VRVVAIEVESAVVLMSAGRVVQVGTPEDVYLRPATEFAADFLGVGTRLAACAERGGIVLDEGQQRLPYAGTERGSVAVVLRSSISRSTKGWPALGSKSRCSSASEYLAFFGQL
jgi:ABC-type Fe3+/spermidine/putrescine transport system ATPase subunit